MRACVRAYACMCAHARACVPACIRMHIVCYCQKLMSRRLSVVPAGEDVAMVTWQELEQAISDGWKIPQAVNKLGGRLGSSLRWGSPRPLPFYCCTVFYYVDVYNLFHNLL